MPSLSPSIILGSPSKSVSGSSGAISEIARVLKPGGRVFLNVLNSRYFERWPLSSKTATSYREFQPFYHASDEDGWRNVLESHHLREVTFVDYFDKDVSKLMAKLDYRYSAFYFKKAFSLDVFVERFMPATILRKKWRSKLGSLAWDAEPGKGSGFMIAATKRSE